MAYTRILILKWGAIGDFIAGTTAIYALRQHYPQANITLLANHIGRDICPPGSIVDEHLAYETLKQRGLLGAIAEIRRRRFDLAVNLKWSSQASTLVSWFSGAETAGAGPRILRHFYDHSPPRHTDEDNRHEYLKNLDIAEAVGVPHAEPRAYLHRGQVDREFAAEFYRTKGLDPTNTLLLAPGASSPLKAWPAERYVEIGRRFVRELGGRILVSGGKQDAAVAAQVTAQIGADAVLAPQSTLSQIGAITELARLCICNNSGMLHIAYATETPVLCINTSLAWAPYGPLATGINAYPPGTHRSRRISLEQTAHLLAGITVPTVWEALERAWQRSAHARM